MSANASPLTTPNARAFASISGSWLDTAQAASLLGISTVKMRQLLKNGSVVGRRWGRRTWRIHTSTIERLIQQV